MSMAPHTTLRAALLLSALALPLGAQQPVPKVTKDAPAAPSAPRTGAIFGRVSAGPRGISPK